MRLLCFVVLLLTELIIITAKTEELLRRLHEQKRRHLNLGTEDAANGQCETTYSNYVECLVMNMATCTGCNLGNPGLGRKEGCEEFREFYDENNDCCVACKPALNSFKECKSCDVINVPAETTGAPEGTPTQSPRTEAPVSPIVPTIPPIGEEFSMSMSMVIPPTNAPTRTGANGKVTGFVFDDRNGNGALDPGEEGLIGVVIIIEDLFGFFQQKTTNTIGYYEADVASGFTKVTIDESSVPPQSIQTVGTNPTTLNVPAGGTATDLDGFYVPTPTLSPTVSATTSPTVLATASPTVSATTTPPTAGPKGKVKGIVFEDSNGNGALDPNEKGLIGVAVTITDSTSYFKTVTTDGS